MNNIIAKHRSIRQYKSEPIPTDILNDILTAAGRASTTGNMQVFSIIVSQDQASREALAPAHFNQPMVTQAPILLTFCADYHRFNTWCKQREASPGYDNFLSFMTGTIDALLAAQNACIQAEEHGLGCCYLGTTTYNADKIIETLNLPTAVVPVTTLVIGYPESTPELTDRLPLEGIVHHEHYKPFTAESINAIYREKESLGETKQLIKENKTESLAQIFTDKRYKKEDNEFFSSKYLATIKAQGFL